MSPVPPRETASAQPVRGAPLAEVAATLIVTRQVTGPYPTRRAVANQLRQRPSLAAIAMPISRPVSAGETMVVRQIS